MFSVARIACRSTLSNVRLADVRRDDDIVDLHERMRRLDRLVFEHIRRVTAELARFAGVGDILLDRPARRGRC